MFPAIIIILALGIVGYYFFDEKYLYPQKIKKINSLLDEKNYEEALSMIQNLPDSKRIDPNIQIKVHDIYLKQSQYFMALFHLNEILKRNQFTPEISEIFVHLKIAEVYELMEKHKKALNEYHSVVSLDEDNYQANSKIGEKLFQMKNYAAALPYLEKAYATKQDHTQIIEYLAEVYFKNENYEASIEKCNQAIELGEDNSPIHLLRGKAFLKSQDIENCLKDMEIVDKDPNYMHVAKVIMGIAHFAKNDLENAEKFFAFNLNKFNEDYNEFILEARYDYSQILLKTGKLKDSLRQLYLIKNSNKTFKDTSERLFAYNQLLNSTIFSGIFEDELGNFIKTRLAKGLAINAHTIQKVEVIDPQCAFFSTRKNVSSGQSFSTVIGFDLRPQSTSSTTIKRFLIFIKGLELSSGHFYALFGIDPEGKVLLKSSDSEVHVLSFKELEKTLMGERNL